MPRDTDHVADIVSAARWIQSYVSGVSREQFDNEPMRQDAVLRQVTIIGEAIRRLSDDFRLAHADIPWRDSACAMWSFMPTIALTWMNSGVWRIAR